MTVMSDDELVDAACPKIGSLGGAFYFAPETLARGKEIDLDGFRFYIAGRGGVLGDCHASVVASAFGYFNPELVARMWDTARERISPVAAAEAYFECAAEFGRRRFAGVDGLDALADAAAAVNAAADPAGLTLYAGAAQMALASDAPGRAMQLVAVLRELRGSAHLVAVLACGLSAARAHMIRRPNDIKLFGWDENQPEPSDEERAQLAAADALTNQLVKGPYSVLDDTARQALVNGLEAMQKAVAAS